MSRIPWTRHWIPPDRPLRLEVGAYLPRGDLLASSNPDVVDLAEISDRRCLMLIGEPGSGKTDALQAFAEEVGSSDDGTALYCDLGDFVDQDSLRDDVFGSEVVRDWVTGEGHLHLFLDSLDEAKINIRKAAALLRRELQAIPLERLRLRIACRAAERVPSFEAFLGEAFDQDFGVYELCPLSRSDVRMAAEARGVDAVDTFLEQVTARGADGLAAKPLTLFFLVDLFRAAQELPQSTLELYRQGLLFLCREHDEEREEPRPLTDTGRFAVASRIAAATVLTSKEEVVAEQASPLGTVGITELLGGHEVDRLIAVRANVDVTEAAIRDALRSGLFTARGTGVGWAHRAFGEFLCAWWIGEGGLSDDQILDLVCNTEPDGPRVVPNLESMVGWLLALRPSLSQVLTAADRALLLFGDPSAVDPSDRRQLFRDLLEAVGAEELDELEIRNLLGRITYDEIAEDVRSAALNDELNLSARLAAIEVAAALDLDELNEVLGDIALGEDQPLRLRVRCAYGLADIADPALRERFRPVAVGFFPYDIDDELKGAALRVAWPAGLSAVELFGGLTHPRNPNLLGAYGAFLRSDLVPGLEGGEDLREAVRWAAGVPREHHATSDFAEVADQIVVKAWPLAVTDGEIADNLADLVEQSLRAYVPILMTSLRPHDYDDVISEAAPRRELVLRLVPRLSEEGLSARALAVSEPRLIHESDVTWLGEQLEASVGSDIERNWAELIDGVMPNDSDALWDLRMKSSVLRELTRWRYEAIRLDSPEAERMRQRHARLAEYDRDESAARVEPEEMDTRIVDHLDRFDGGDLDAFWQLQPFMMVEDTGTITGRGLRANLTETPGWQRAGVAVHERLKSAAFKYVHDADPSVEEWLGRDVNYWPAIAGYVALHLLWSEEPAAFDALDDAVWERWLPVIVCWNRTEQFGSEFDSLALGRVNAADPEAVAAVAARRLDRDLERGHSTPVTLHDLDDIWSPQLETVLLDRFRREELEPEQRVALLQRLMRHDSESIAADEAIEDVFTEERVEEESGRRMATELASVLLEHRPRATWQRLWRLARDARDFGRALFEAIASNREGAWLAGVLSPTEIAEVWSWLVDQYPPEEPTPAAEPPSESRRRFLSVGPGSNVGFLRSALIQELVRRGSGEAVEALHQLAASHPDADWLRRQCRLAEDELRRTDWRPPAPADVVAMGADAARRYVGSDADLQRLVLEALDAIQASLTGSASIAPDFWNTGLASRPKTENELSDRLQRELRDELSDRRTVVNREVQVRPGPHGTMGDRTDLHVQAIGEDDSVLTVVVEVKGAWNQDLDKAMEEQLVEKYLEDGETTFGIYLVTWFAAESWSADAGSSEDTRKRRSLRRDLTTAREFFGAQAQEISKIRGVHISTRVLDGSL